MILYQVEGATELYVVPSDTDTGKFSAYFTFADA